MIKSSFGVEENNVPETIAPVWDGVVQFEQKPLLKAINSFIENASSASPSMNLASVSLTKIFDTSKEALNSGRHQTILASIGQDDLNNTLFAEQYSEYRDQIGEISVSVFQAQQGGLSVDVVNDLADDLSQIISAAEPA